MLIFAGMIPDNFTAKKKLLMGSVLSNTLATIEGLVDHFSITETHEELFYTMGDELEKIIAHDKSAFYLWNDLGNKLRLLHAKGFNEEERKAAENTALERHPGHVFKSGKLFYTPDQISHPSPVAIESIKKSKVRSRLYVPVRCSGKIIGTFGIQSELTNAFSEDDIAVLKVFASLAAEAYTAIAKKVALVKKNIENEKLTTLAKNTTNSVMYTDIEGNITWVNKRFEEFTGYELHEIIGKKPGSFLQGKNTEAEKAEELRKAQATLTSCKTIITNYSKNGVECKVDVQLSPVFNEAGELTNFIAIQQDVTQEELLRKEAQLANQQLRSQFEDILALKDQFRALVENTSDLVTSLDEQGTILYANDTWLNKTGYAKEDVLHTSIFQYIHPDSREHCSLFFGNLRDKAKETFVSYSIIDKQGQVIELEGNVVTRFKEGKLYLINSYLQDRTEWNKTQRREEQYRAALVNYKNALDSAAIVSIADREGIIKYVNDKFCEVSKYSRNELIGNNHSIVNSDHHDKPFWEDFWKTITKGKIWRGEVKNRAKDGSIYWVDSTIIPFMKDDVIEEYISIRYEITENVRNKEDILAQKAFYENILHNIPVDIAVFNEKHQYIFLNKESIKNNELREWLIGKDDFDYANLKGLPASFAQARRDKFNEVLGSESDIVWVDKQLAPTGEVRFKERRFHTYADKKTMIGYAVDITGIKLNELELKRSKEELLFLNQNLETEIETIKLSNTSLENFAYSISHDLKAPLRNIGSFSGLLQRAIERNNPAEIDQFLQFINAGVYKMTEQINALLKFSTYGTAPLKVSEFSLREELDKACTLYRNLVEPSRFTFENRVEASVRADKTLISTVLENLLSNAIKYSMPKNEVHLKVYEKMMDGEVVFCVEDKGIGFDMTQYDRIFALFQRLHGQEVEGLGIGLSHVQRIIERHNGKIWAESEVGIGTTFYFTIPSINAMNLTMIPKMKIA